MYFLRNGNLDEDLAIAPVGFVETLCIGTIISINWTPSRSCVLDIWLATSIASYFGLIVQSLDSGDAFISRSLSISLLNITRTLGQNRWVLRLSIIKTESTARDVSKI